MPNRKYTKEYLEPIVKKCNSVREICKVINGKFSGSQHALISERIREYKIDTSHFRYECKGGGLNKKSPEQIFVKGCRGRRSQLKRALIEVGVEYVCKLCGQKPYWEEKELLLQIDHIDGNKTNHLRENLRFLCPNCHQQTETYCKPRKEFQE